MRQRGQKQFCQILNRLRVGELTNNDQQILNKCKVEKHDLQYVATARHFLSLCVKHVENIMNNCMKVLSSQKLTDTLCG